MVEPELEFWGCQQSKMVAATNFGPSLAEKKGLRKPRIAVDLFPSLKISARRICVESFLPSQKGQFRWSF